MANLYDPNKEEINAIISEAYDEGCEDSTIVESFRDTFGVSSATGYRWIRKSKLERDKPDAFIARELIEEFKLNAIEYSNKTLTQLKNTHSNNPEEGNSIPAAIGKAIKLYPNAHARFCLILSIACFDSCKAFGSASMFSPSKTRSAES